MYSGLLAPPLLMSTRLMDIQVFQPRKHQDLFVYANLVYELEIFAASFMDHIRVQKGS